MHVAKNRKQPHPSNNEHRVSCETQSQVMSHGQRLSGASLVHLCYLSGPSSTLSTRDDAAGLMGHTELQRGSEGAELL